MAKAKSKTITKNPPRIDPESGRPYPDRVIGLVFDFWGAWMRYRVMTDTYPEKHPDRETAWDEFSKLEDEISETIPTSLRGLLASADLFKQLTATEIIGDYSAARWPSTIAEGLLRVSGYEPPRYLLYPAKARS